MWISLYSPCEQAAKASIHAGLRAMRIKQAVAAQGHKQNPNCYLIDSYWRSIHKGYSAISFKQMLCKPLGGWFALAHFRMDFSVITRH
jgi:hypothetical protein